MCAVFALAAQEPIAIPVWPDGAPNDNGITDPARRLDAVMYVYPADPAKNTGAAVVCLPGGGYAMLSKSHEGHQIAQWLATEGITGVLLEYRLPNGHHEIPSSDARQAIRLVREKGAEWGVDPNKVGISGCSAGGHLASTVATHQEDAASTPNFAVLFYPVIASDPTIWHKSSYDLLTGGKDQELLDFYSNDHYVTAQTPPTILFHSQDDGLVPVEHSLRFFSAMNKNGVKGALYVFPNGNHGWGFMPRFRYHEEWKTLLLKWLEDMRFIQK
jgi:acetyl esterase/lipase